MLEAMNSTTTTPGGKSIAPVVFVKGGAVFANSRDVAAFFDKEHRNVLRDIDALIASEPTLGREDGGLLKFEHTPYVDPQNGRTFRSFDMTRDAFSLLAMGFTGAKALRFKMRYVAQFSAMEAELRERPSVDPMTVLNDPAAMRGLLLTYTEKVIALQAQNDAMRPDVAALERIGKSDGSMCITDAAKTLQVAPRTLFRFLVARAWIYKRAGSAAYVAYQDRIQGGYLELKTSTLERADGSDKTVAQVRVTPKGLARLAKLLATETPHAMAA